MSNQRFIQVAAVLAGVVLIGGASFLLRPINANREAMGLSATVKDVENMPPEIALSTQALGGFRGLAVDYFWIRAENLKQEGRYYEANQLANWICKLQPRFPKVWSFQAWNLAFNISVGTRTADERWNWVHNGIKLLRDEGIRYNPKSLGLYRELAWLFFFKMGDYMDDQHWNYKRRWAWDMHRILGDPPPDIQAESVQTELAAILAGRTEEASPLAAPKDENAGVFLEVAADPSVRRVIEWLRPVAEAPATWAELLADPQAAALVQRCEATGIQLRDRSLGSEGGIDPAFFDRYQRLLTPSFKQQMAKAAGKLTLTPDEQALDAILADPASRPVADKMLAFLRRQALGVKYRLDAPWMLALMERLGPIDWRLPDSHGLYWTSYGIKQIDDLQVKDVGEFFGPNSSLNTDRIMLFALQRLTNYGRLFYVPNLENVDESRLNLLPDLRFVTATHRAYLETGLKYDPEAKRAAGFDLRDGHQNYLRDTLRLFYIYGQRAQAEFYYDYLRRNYKLQDGTDNPDYQMPLADFVRHEEFMDRLSDPRIAVDVMAGMINQAMDLMMNGAGEQATGMIRYARHDIYDWYMARWKDNPVDRMKLPPFEQILADTIVARLSVAARSQDEVGLKARLWKSLPLDVQLDAYDAAFETFKADCAAMDLADRMDLVYPPPPGLEEYRKTHVQQPRQPAGNAPYTLQELQEQLRQAQEQNRQDRLDRRLDREIERPPTTSTP